MRGGISERSSILLIGRNTVVIGAILITVASFGIGYFFGFRGSGVSEHEKPVVQTAKTAETLPLEEKQVIDLPVKDLAGKAVSSQAAPAKEAEPDAESADDKQAQPADGGEKPKAVSEAEPSGNLKTVSDQNKKTKKNENKTVAPAANQVQADASVQPARPAEADKAESVAPKTGKHAAGKAKKKTKGNVAGGKLYAVQIGAFPNKEGAEQLFENLKASGYSPYIINASEDNAYFKVRVGTFKSKKDAEKNAAELLKKTGLQNFVTAAQ